MSVNNTSFAGWKTKAAAGVAKQTFKYSAKKMPKFVFKRLKDSGSQLISRKNLIKMLDNNQVLKQQIEFLEINQNLILLLILIDEAVPILNKDLGQNTTDKEEGIVLDQIEERLSNEKNLEEIASLVSSLTGDLGEIAQSESLNYIEEQISRVQRLQDQ
ncbi:MAG: hypothetical protein KDD58_12935 [Bdellovibrionales bacterium]|nr:hypothetical protein [Bdellovibrionales bacterium]